jgi:hypothetical protein
MTLVSVATAQPHLCWLYLVRLPVLMPSLSTGSDHVTPRVSVFARSNTAASTAEKARTRNGILTKNYGSAHSGTDFVQVPLQSFMCFLGRYLCSIG